ncbi:hypothetical protein GUJ93_ZPchr0003g18087 [Zizania palustris]|uniref:Uncharacterized protein n=1 Tax=Zizania palustris TaxID=103762 RepID=A0A8J5S6F2_ZIZPA|nr:hypothetical protein GUJ93_ZPchr0003g18087 [Zizania palustris]
MRPDPATGGARAARSGDRRHARGQIRWREGSRRRWEGSRPPDPAAGGEPAATPPHGESCTAVAATLLLHHQGINRRGRLKRGEGKTEQRGGEAPGAGAAKFLGLLEEKSWRGGEGTAAVWCGKKKRQVWEEEKAGVGRRKVVWELAK